MLRLPELDDRTWADLVDEARSLIPSLSPAWTDHNPSDPGIALIELFAWLSEMVMYRLNELPDDNYWTFLKLINGSEVNRRQGLDAAIREVVLDLRSHHRAITSRDYEHMALEQWPTSKEAGSLGWRKEVLRVRCLPERNLEADPDVEAPGHVSVVAMPRRRVLSFDGLTDYMSCAIDPYQRLNGDITVSAWICPGNVPKGYQPILTRGGEFSLVMHDTGHVSLGHGTDPLGPSHSAVMVKTGRWSHITITRSTADKTVSFFLNGVGVASKPYTEEPLQDTGPIWIAGTPDSTCNFEGVIIDAQVWRRVRTKDEIAAELIHPSGVGTKDLVAGLSEPRSPGWISSSGVLLDDPALFGPVWRFVAHDDLTNGLKKMFELRRLVTTRVHLISPAYTEISVEATLYLRMDADTAAVRTRADAAVRGLFDPAIGWRDRHGWPFGRSLYLSDLYTALEGVEGVDFVKDGRLSASDPARDLYKADAELTDGATPYGVKLRIHELPLLKSVRFKLLQPWRTQWREVTT